MTEHETNFKPGHKSEAPTRGVEPTQVVLANVHEEMAEEIGRISPEGVPGDTNAGPGLLTLELVILVLVLGAISVAAAIWLGWPVGLGILAIAALAFALNPSAMAALFRIGERRKVANRHSESKTKVTIVKSAGFRKTPR